MGGQGPQCSNPPRYAPNPRDMVPGSSGCGCEPATKRPKHPRSGQAAIWSSFGGGILGLPPPGRASRGPPEGAPGYPNPRDMAPNPRDMSLGSSGGDFESGAAEGRTLGFVKKKKTTKIYIEIIDFVT